jgi:solute carrier family 25 carnitine/acylcarnitine transporter 20/29
MSLLDYVYKETAAGASAGVIGTVLGYPLDVLKTRQQVSGTSIPQTMRAIYAESGLIGYYRGVASPLLSLTILNTLNFSTYATTRSLIGIPTNFDITTAGIDLRIGLAGAAVGPLSALISTPFELVKTQMQLSARNFASSPSYAGKRYENSVQAALHIGKTYGVQSLYRGYVVNTTREMVFLGMYFTVYEHVKSLLSMSSSGMSPSVAVPFAGGLAGAIGWLVSFPLDCIKSNIQGANLQSQAGGVPLRVNTVAAARELVRAKGFLGLYAGVVPSILRAFIVSSSRFSAYEATIWALSDS